MCIGTHSPTAALAAVVVRITVSTNSSASAFEVKKIKSAVGTLVDMNTPGLSLNISDFPTLQLSIIPNTIEQRSTVETKVSSFDISVALNEEWEASKFTNQVTVVRVIVINNSHHYSNNGLIHRLQQQCQQQCSFSA